ncbi:MAG: hypothetical protein JWQ16_3430 [Novosphingobium sp.]|nr:hypothetical protein [Novosphingobium sp.]
MSLPEQRIADVSGPSVKWVEVPKANLAGDGLASYPPGDFAGLFDWAERTDTTSIHIMPYAGQFLIDVVEIEDNAVHQPSKPTNEIVCILNGILELVTDGTEIPQRFGQGEMVLIPAGWAGKYRAISSDTGWFRELCIVPANYFDPATIPPPSGLLPVAIKRLGATGEQSYAKAPYSVLVQRLDQSREWKVAATTDQIIHVLDGTLSLRSEGEVGCFDAGSFVVLPKGFVGKADASGDFHAMIAQWV